MLFGKILNSDATLNNFSEIGNLNFIPGEEITLVIRLVQQDKDQLRFIPNDVSSLTLNLATTEGVTEVTMTAMTGDKSIWSGVVTPSQSDIMLGGNINFTLDNNGTEVKGWVQNALSVIKIGGCV